MDETKNSVLKNTVKKYGFKLIEMKNLGEPLPEICNIESEVLELLAFAFEKHNATADKGYKWRIPDTLHHAQIAELMLIVRDVRLISFTEDEQREYMLLGLFNRKTGIYDTSEDKIRVAIREFCFSITSKGIEEVIAILRDQAANCRVCNDRYLIPMKNGVFHYGTKKMSEYTPELIFTFQYQYNYNPLARNPVIHSDEDGTDWDVESWVSELNDDPKIVDLLWQIIGAILRPFENWDKAAFLYATTGNNGKGTLCELMRNLVGKGTYASIPVSDFGKDFMLEPLIRAAAIIVDENNVGEFIDKCANLKSVITNDIIQINRKNRTPIKYRFQGFMIQCFNEFPRVKDTSDSFYRRQLFVPFDKCFTGRVRAYIKHDYLNRTEVLEFVVFKVLNLIPDYYKLDEPKACVDVLNDFKSANNPIVGFWEENKTEFVWTMLPLKFVYDFFRVWYQDNFNSQTSTSYAKFRRELCRVVGSDWDYSALLNVYSTTIQKFGLDKPEPLITKHGLTSWQNPNYGGGNLNQQCTIHISNQYRHVLIKN